MAAVHPPSLLRLGTCWGMRTCSPGQQLLRLLNKVATEALGAFLFFFLLHFIEMIMVRCQTFLNAQKELPSDLLSSQLVTPGRYVTEKVRRGSSSCHMKLMVFYRVSGF